MIKILYDKFANLIDKPIDVAIKNFKLGIGTCMIVTSIILIFEIIKLMGEDKYLRTFLFSSTIEEYFFCIIILLVGLFTGIKWIREYFKEKIDKVKL